MADPEFLSETEAPHERAMAVLDEGRRANEDDPFGLMRLAGGEVAAIAGDLARRGSDLAVQILAAAREQPDSNLAGCNVPAWFVEQRSGRAQTPFCLHLERPQAWKGILSLAPAESSGRTLAFRATLTLNGRSRAIMLDVPAEGPYTLASEQDGYRFSRAISRDPDPETNLRGLVTALLEHVVDPRFVTAPATGLHARPDGTAPGAEPATVRMAIAPVATTRRIPIYDFAELTRAVDDLDLVPELGDADGENPPDDLTDAPTGGAGREIFAGDRDMLLRALVRGGAEGALRELRVATPATREAVQVLGARAPHLAEVTARVLRQVEFSIHTGLPLRLPPLLLLDEPGTGKTWYLSRLARALGLPYVRQPMTGVSLSEGFQGGHPNWRNARHGIVAQALLKERVANPLIFVDEFDKPQANSYQTDPYRPFYVLHEPEGAADFIDEYLRFPLNARHILWVMAANSLDPFPEPILQRLSVIRVPAITPEHMRTIVASVYDECNLLNEHWFAREITEAVREALIDRVPREVRKAIEEAMVRAGSENRREIAVGDIPAISEERGRIGFR